MATDYVADALNLPGLDFLFPNMIVGDKDALTWPYFRRGVDHNWYTDRRNPQVGFINKDEASILYAAARQFAGRRGLEVGAWRGWSTCHLVAAGLERLHVVEPLLADEAWRAEFAAAVAGAGGAERAVLVPAKSPEAVRRLGEGGARWSFVFIDGDHDGDAPTADALACEPYLEETAMIMFHDLVSPHVAAALRTLRERGWNTAVHQTAQMMGAAWRGDVRPVRHVADPTQAWTLPAHLAGFAVDPQA